MYKTFALALLLTLAVGPGVQAGIIFNSREGAVSGRVLGASSCGCNAASCLSHGPRCNHACDSCEQPQSLCDRCGEVIPPCGVCDCGMRTRGGGGGGFGGLGSGWLGLGALGALAAIGDGNGGPTPFDTPVGPGPNGGPNGGPDNGGVVPEPASLAIYVAFSICVGCMVFRRKRSVGTIGRSSGSH